MSENNNGQSEKKNEIIQTENRRVVFHRLIGNVSVFVSSPYDYSAKEAQLRSIFHLITCNRVYCSLSLWRISVLRNDIFFSSSSSFFFIFSQHNSPVSSFPMSLSRLRRAAYKTPVLYQWFSLAEKVDACNWKRNSVTFLTFLRKWNETLSSVFNIVYKASNI